MKQFFRTMRVGASAFLWIVKGMLLLLAATILVLWPISRNQTLEIGKWMWLIQPQRVDMHTFSLAVDHGRFLVMHFHAQHIAGEYLDLGRELAARHGNKWVFKKSPYGYGQMLRSGWGPFRWWLESQRTPLYAEEIQWFSSPCWMESLALASWPLLSIGLLIRKRIRQANQARIGYCRLCGYDLRATPEATKLLGRCPECGTGAPPQAGPAGQ